MLRANMMDTISYSEFRAHLAEILDKVNDDHKPIMVTRQKGRPAVVISLEDFQAYEATAYLMASPKNAKRLNQAIAEIEEGRVVRHGLIKE
jgi:antitoxin YefM